MARAAAFSKADVMNILMLCMMLLPIMLLGDMIEFFASDPLQLILWRNLVPLTACASSRSCSGPDGASTSP